LRAFWAERALPSAERGPVDLAAFSRLAASCFSETGVDGSGNRMPSYSLAYHGDPV